MADRQHINRSFIIILNFHSLLHWSATAIVICVVYPLQVRGTFVAQWDFYRCLLSTSETLAGRKQTQTQNVEAKSLI